MKCFVVLWFLNSPSLIFLLLMDILPHRKIIVKPHQHYFSGNLRHEHTANNHNHSDDFAGFKSFA